MKRLRIGVVYGGRSSEHEVSLASAAAIFANLDPTRYEAIPIYVGRDGRWSLPERPPTELSAGAVVQATKAPTAPATDGSEVTVDENASLTADVHFPAYPNPLQLITLRPEPGRPGRAAVAGLALDVVFPVIHGPHGEDGTLQGLLELANIPYVGAGVLASALAMDKAMAKVVFAAHGLPVTEYVVVSAGSWHRARLEILADLARRLPDSVFVKPANLGSSVGISRVTDRQGPALEEAIDRAQQFDTKVIVEAAVSRAREIECAVLGNEVPQASLPGEIISGGDFYDYDAKYIDGRSRTIVPAELTDAQVKTIQNLAGTAYKALDIVGMARVDFLLDPESKTTYINEINTIPGFTAISMYSKMWDASGLPYPALLDRLIELGRDRHRQKQNLRTSAL